MFEKLAYVYEKRSVLPLKLKFSTYRLVFKVLLRTVFSDNKPVMAGVAGGADIKLLIADDEISIRKGLEELDWHSIGLTVCFVAGDGDTALEAIQRFRPDIILTDISMPGLDGPDLAQYVYEHDMDCQLIFLSGYNDFKYAKSAITFGVFDYILKPSDPDEILKCVQRAAETLRINRTLDTSVALMREELKTRKIADVAASGSQSDDALSMTDKAIRHILNYIDENYMKDISLVTISNKINFNVIYICRILKKKTGHTFLEILVAVRMLHAARLLTSTDYKISRVAEDIGISDQKYFSQIFKKTYNMTPNEYRKNHTADAILDIASLLNGTGVSIQ